jgi:hypothetical protein
MTPRKKSHNYYSMETLKRAESRRQDVLDLLNANPGGASFDTIKNALPQHRLETLRGTVANLTARSEVAVSGSSRDKWYHAIAKTTHTAESVYRAKLDRTARNAKKKPAKKLTDEQTRQRAERRAQAAEEKRAAAEPWRMVYRSGDNPAISKHQRGQGAVRQRVCVNCFHLF